jgi:TPR repeat protein
MTSPRLHVAGDVPPELSPLDAFAAQSRLLSKQLEGCVHGGKRVSRLPPLTIASSFNSTRPGFLRSISADDSSPTAAQQPQSPRSELKTELEVSPFRPVSVYPHVSSLPPSRAGLPSPRLPFQDDEEHFRGRRLATPRSDFGTRMDRSPSPLEQDTVPLQPEASPYSPRRPSIEPIPRRSQPRQILDVTATAPFGYDTKTLVPPRSPFTQRASSIGSTSIDDSDEDYPLSMGASFLTESRKFSSSSGFSNSPVSPLAQPAIPRSPSVGSDVSTPGSRLSRPTFNFSRPLSRASEPLVTDTLPRQASSDNQTFIPDDDTMHTPVSIHSEELPERGNPQPAAQSYVYSRFSLPRGKMLRRSPQNFQESQLPAEFRGDRAATVSHSEGQPFTDGIATAQVSQLSRPSTPSFDQTLSASVPELSTQGLSRHSEDQSNSRHNQSKNQNGSTLNTHIDQGLAPSSSVSGGAVKTLPPHSLVPSADCSAEEHVTKGIECHERGSLNESTYHLRIAARQNNPTGMLLYALACRHGWGMRPNQREGVQWLRRAADFALLEVAGDEDLLKEGRRVDVLEQKTRKAQFALSIYELGVSHMNGWGVEQDKILALRCFEIAGCTCSAPNVRLPTNTIAIAWGDGDALAEAGFCYAQGIGCKKDLKKSARFYRLAESKGISMVGNSW